MTPTLTRKPTVAGHPPRILLVDDEPSLVELIRDVVSHEMPCRILTAATRAEAAAIVRREPIELLVADVNLPDGDGTTLLDELRRRQPQARAIVMSGAPSVDCAVNALRGGAIDFIAKPFTADRLAQHVRGALGRQAARVKEEKRLDRLRDAVKKLNAARKVVSKKVDLLCNDLIAAYGELAKQMDEVRTAEDFRKSLTSAGDLEQLLCNAMDWLLRRLGYTNIAIWLAAEEHDFQLGAYMKYTHAGDGELAGALKSSVLPHVLRDGAVRWSVDETHDRLDAAAVEQLSGQAMMGVNCVYLGESLGAVVVFRDGEKPFTDADARALSAIAPIFSNAMAGVVRPDPGADHPFADGPGADGSPSEPRDADGEWWMRGEAPPF